MTQSNKGQSETNQTGRVCVPSLESRLLLLTMLLLPSLVVATGDAGVGAVGGVVVGVAGIPVMSGAVGDRVGGAVGDADGDTMLES